MVNAALLNVNFILHYHSFVREKIYFFKYLYFSEYLTGMSLYVFWLRKEISIKYVCNRWGMGGHPKCIQLRTGGGGGGRGGEESHVMLTYVLTISFHVFRSILVL